MTSDIGFEEFIWGDSESSNIEGQVLMLKDMNGESVPTVKEDQINKKLSYIRNEKANQFRKLFDDCSDMIANWFDDLRLCKLGALQNFKLVDDKPIFQKEPLVLPACRVIQKPGLYFNLHLFTNWEGLCFSYIFISSLALNFYALQ